MKRESMTSLERWQSVLRRQKPDRVPLDYWSTPEFDAKLIRRLGVSTIRDALVALHVDFVVRPKPLYAGPPLPEGQDAFGCRFREVAFEDGTYTECVAHPLAGFQSIGEIESRYTWPSADRWDYGSLADQLRGYEEYPVRGGGSEPFLTYKYLRGDEQAFLDLIEHPDIARYCLDKLFGLDYENTRRIFESLPRPATICYVAEDLGGQTDLMMSPRHIREFLLPGMKRMIDLAHEAGTAVFHHDDGSCRRILPDLVEAGIDILNPIQWRCPGMDREGLKRDFGPSLVFHGGMDNQATLPFGSPEEIRSEVRDNLRILGAGGGYILAPCHNIQPLTPVDNVIAMYETGYREGWI